MSQASEATALAVELAATFDDPRRVLMVCERLRALAEDLAELERQPLAERFPGKVRPFHFGPVSRNVHAEIATASERR